MKAVEVAKLVEGQKLFISWKGVKPCTFKNAKGGKSFVWFDNGNGEGVKLHYVFSSLLLAEDDPRVIEAGFGKPKTTPKKAEPKAKKVAPKAEPKIETPKAEPKVEVAKPSSITDGLNAMQIIELAKALKTLDELGFSVKL